MSGTTGSGTSTSSAIAMKVFAFYLDTRLVQMVSLAVAEEIVFSLIKLDQG